MTRWLDDITLRKGSATVPKWPKHDREVHVLVGECRHSCEHTVVPIVITASHFVRLAQLRIARPGRAPLTRLYFQGVRVGAYDTRNAAFSTSRR